MASNAVIGSLRVDLGLDSAKFASGLKAAKIDLTGFAKSMDKLGATFRTAVIGFGAGAASALTLSAAINGTKAALDQFGKIADQAAQAGVGTDVFQGVASFASQSGVAIDEVSSALNTFAKNSGLAAVGKGKLVSTLQKLNPELLKNLQLTTDQEERMRLAADAIAKAGSASERAALSTALFGDAGAKMAVVFQGGSAALDGWMNKARDLGLIIDKDVIKRADEMGDSFQIAAQALDGQLKQAFVDIAPLMIDAARFAGDVAREINKVIDLTRELGNKSREGLERERADLMQLLGDATSMGDMNANPMAVGLPADQVETMKKQLATIDAELRRRAMDDLRVRLAELPKQVDDTANEVASKVNLEPLDLGIGNTTAALERMNDVGKSLGDTMAGAFSGFADAVLSGVPPLQALGDELGNLAKQIASSAITGLFTSIFTGGVGSIFGGIGGFLGSGGGPANLLNVGSFAGGGYTGDGARSGGLDGMGGFPAILHPNETVVDHSMGQTFGGGGGQVNNFYIDAKGAEIGVEKKIVQAIQSMVPPMIDTRAPAAVAKTQRNRSL